MPPHIHMASDHAGFGLKSALMLRLASLGYDLEDHGTHSTESCDYPTYAQRLSHALLQHRDRGDLGILVCGTGIGMSIMANRMPGIRAALCTNEFQARATRQHNNANVLCLGERVTGTGLAFSIVDAFLDTAFEGGRHQRRIDLIDNPEHNA